MKFATKINEKYHICLASELESPAYLDGLKALWTLSFDDTQLFIDFFFSKRDRPEDIVCATYEDKIIGMIHSLPVDTLVRGTRISSSIVAGVATHPEHRGQGLMKAMFEYLYQVLKSRGIFFITHHPVNFNVYKSMGHLSTSEYLLYSLPPQEDYPARGESNTQNKQIFANKIHPILYKLDSVNDKGTSSGGSSTPDKGFIELFKLNDIKATEIDDSRNLYQDIAQGYSGMVYRTDSYYRLKLQDYTSSEARMITYRLEGKLQAYAIIFIDKEDSSLFLEEVIYSDTSHLRILLNFLIKEFSKSKIQAKLPANLDARMLFSNYCPGSISLMEQNASGVTDVQSLVKELSLDRLAPSHLLKDLLLEIKDNFWSCNNRVLNLLGEDFSDKKDKAATEAVTNTYGADFHTDQKSPITVDIGSFTRFLTGFISFKELLAISSLEVDSFNQNFFEELAPYLDKENCRIIDEY